MIRNARTHTDGYVRNRETQEPIPFVVSFNDTPFGTDALTTIERPKEHSLWPIFVDMGERKFRKKFPKAKCPPARWCAREIKREDGTVGNVAELEIVAGPFEWATWDQWNPKFGPLPPGHGPKGPPRPQQQPPPARPVRPRTPAPLPTSPKRVVAGHEFPEAPADAPTCAAEALALMRAGVRAAVTFPRTLSLLGSPPPGTTEGVDQGSL